MKSTLAIVPARTGSKGIRGKNLARVGGRPLIEWTLRCAAAARCIDRVIVTTDGEAIARVARRCGAEVPFLRPEVLARDDTPGIEPVLHALSWLDEHEGYRPDWVVLLQPTSPLRTSRDVDAALGAATSSHADSVVSVTPTQAHPWWSRSIDAEQRLGPFLLETPTRARRQDLPPAYQLNGAVYAARREVLIARRGFEGPCTRAYVMPAERSVDIDGHFERELADWLLRRRESPGRRQSERSDPADDALDIGSAEAG